MKAPFVAGQELNAAVQAAYDTSLSGDFAPSAALYGRPDAATAQDFMGYLMTLPMEINSKAGCTFATWFAMFPFVNMQRQSVSVDEVFVADGGYKLLFFNRWHGECNGSFKTPAGDVLDLAGRSFKDLRYTLMLEYDRETGAVKRLAGGYDVAEWGRLMGSSAFALASAAHQIY